jgi:hypothetical protein
MIQKGYDTQIGQMRNTTELIREIFTEVPGLDGTVFKTAMKMKFDDRCQWSNKAQTGSIDGPFCST